MKTAQVHRFGDKIAVYLGNGETVYLTVAESRKITRAIHLCRHDIERKTLKDSEFRAETIEFNGSRYQ